MTTLEDVPFSDIHACFAQAFFDYAVQSAVMSEVALQRRALKNNFLPQCSAGAWSGDQLVAISLTGVDEVGGEKRGYDICTGVVQAHRSKGLAGQLLATLLGGLKREGAQAFQLEVLQPNQAAIRAYEKGGFTVTRSLVSHAGQVGSASVSAAGFRVQPVELSDLVSLSTQLDFEPSYEQRDSALAYLADELILLGALADGTCVAALAFDPETNCLMRLVVHRDFRHRGVARALLGMLGRRLMHGTVVRAVNIDKRDDATRQLMLSCGLAETIWQYEMRLEL